MSVDELLRSGRWTPIPGCPGRWVLRRAEEALDQVVSADSLMFVTTGATDPVHLLLFSTGGGLLSYSKRDGSFVHTLNTPAGLGRKWSQLGLPPDALNS